VNLAPRHRLGVALYWHCWNLSSDVLDALSAALRHAAGESLRPAAAEPVLPRRRTVRAVRPALAQA
jgi:hypothetical protein